MSSISSVSTVTAIAIEAVIGFQFTANRCADETSSDSADEAASKELFEACIGAGVNFFDTADMYTQGESERILGRLMKSRRDELVIATKVYFPTGEGVNDRGASRYHTMRACEASLRRLDTDRIDVYYIHRFDDGCDLEEALLGIDLLVRQGKILYPAISNFAAWQVQKALGVCELRGFVQPACIQPMYNLLKRQAEVEIFPMAKVNEAIEHLESGQARYRIVLEN